MANPLKGFLAGFSVGFVTLWNCDELTLSTIYSYMGVDRLKKMDYLNISSNLPLEQRRSEFSRIINEKGASFRTVLMINDTNRELFEKEALNGRSGYEFELNILEKNFRKFYPELFDDKSGKEFIESLDLKTKCNDNDYRKTAKNR